MADEESKSEVWLSPFDRMIGARRIRTWLEEWLARLAWRLGYRLQARMDTDTLSPWYDPIFARKFRPALAAAGVAAGEAQWRDKHDLVRRDALLLLADWLQRRGVNGSVAEVGVADGMTAALLSRAFPSSELHLFDTMRGYPDADTEAEVRRTGMRVGVYPYTLNKRTVFQALGATAGRVTFYEGAFPSSAGFEVANSRFCFVHLDVDLYDSTLLALNFFRPLMAEGGIIVVHDYNAWPGAHAAVDEFLVKTDLVAIPLPDKSGSIAICVRRLGASCDE